MKALILNICAAIFIFLLCACSSDAGSEGSFPEFSGDILGKWYHAGSIIDGNEYEYLHEICGKDYYEFTNDAILREVYMRNCEETIYAEDTYRVVGNILSLRYSSIETYDVVIEELTETSLILTVQEDSYGNGNLDEVRIRYNRE